MDGTEAKYKDLFISEATEHLDSLDSGLIELEKDSGNIEILSELMRHSHTLKGIAAAAGYGEISNLAHSFEGMVENLKNKLTKGGITLLFGAVDELRSLVAKASESTGPTIKANPLVDEVGELEHDDKDEDREILEKPHELKTSSEVKVKTEKLDKIMDVVAELTVNKLRLNIISKKDQVSLELNAALEEHNRLVDELQYEILQLRLNPISDVFNRFPRMVRDLAKDQKKEVEFIVNGGNIELDKTILDDLGEPLVHLLRNAVDHGIEKAGKILLSAERLHNEVKITLSDDGRGIEWDKMKKKAQEKGIALKENKDALFAGISTSEHVTEVSGRGVGMSVVKERIESLGGTIQVESETGKGTIFTLNLPISVAIVKSLLINVDKQTYALPLKDIDRLLRLDSSHITSHADQNVVVLDDQEHEVVYLNEILKLPTTENTPKPKIDKTNRNTAVVIKSQNKKYVCIIDSVHSQEDIVVKPLSDDVRSITHISSATILGDGQPIPILDMDTLLEKNFSQQ